MGAMSLFASSIQGHKYIVAIHGHQGGLKVFCLLERTYYYGLSNVMCWRERSQTSIPLIYPTLSHEIVRGTFTVTSINRELVITLPLLDSDIRDLKDTLPYYF